MAFPTIPTVADSRVLFQLATSPAGTHTSPSLTTLVNNSGDLLIAIIIIYDGNSTDAEFSAWGGGFTEFGDFATTTSVSIGCAYKFSDGTETGTFTVTSADTSTNDSCFILLSIPGAHGTTPPEAGGYASGTLANADPNSLNPTNWNIEDTLWIAVAGIGETSTGGTWTGAASAPTSYTDYADSGLSADVIGAIEGAVAFRQLNAASEDPGAFTNDTSNTRWGAITIAVRPLTQVEHAIASDFPLGLTIDSALSPVEKVIAADFPLGLTIDTNLTIPVNHLIALDFPLGLTIDSALSPVEKVIASDFPLGLTIDSNLTIEKLLNVDYPLGLTIDTNLEIETAAPAQTTDTRTYYPVHRGVY